MVQNVNAIPSSLRGSSVCIMSWKMLFLISELCKEAQLPSLCSLGFACKSSKVTKKIFVRKLLKMGIDDLHC